MRFLVDAQLPSALARVLEAGSHEATHVLDVGLAQSSDRQIGEYAQSNGMIVVTKDEDFVELSSERSFVVLWIRLGNCTNEVLVSAIREVLPLMQARFEAGERLVEVR